MGWWAFFVRAFGWFSTVLSLISALLNLYCYTYPSLDPKNCSWAVSDDSTEGTVGNSLLFGATLASVPYFGDLFAHNFLGKDSRDDFSPRDEIRMLAIGDPQINGAWPSTGPRKRLDIFGNDHYLGHIYGVMKRRLEPSHVAVLGDLISCNWVSDSEYFNRTYRYATRLFPRPETPLPVSPESIDLLSPRGLASGTQEYKNWVKTGVESHKFVQEDQYAYQDVYNWDGAHKEPLFINVTGNHDIGYSGEITYDNLYRYSRFYGQPNYWVEYNTNSSHSWRVVVVNSLLLDGPAKHKSLYEAQWQFIHALTHHPFNGSTILVTHVPLHKPDGFCVDGPRIEYFSRDNCPSWDWDKLTNLKGQTLLAPETSQTLLSAVFSNGKPGVILTGHDHDGCITYYSRSRENPGSWIPTRHKPTEYSTLVQEITVRSIMGEYGGNTGLVTGHFSGADEQWQFHYSLCPFVIQHVWWASKVTLILAILFQTLAYFL